MPSLQQVRTSYHSIKFLMKSVREKKRAFILREKTTVIPNFITLSSNRICVRYVG